LAELAMLKDLASLKESHTGWIQEMLPSKSKGREDKWSASIAVGSEKFVSKVKELLGVKVKERRIAHSRGASELREPASSYSNDFVAENASLRAENTRYWHIYPDNTTS
jgi:hypothetical protein